VAKEAAATEAPASAAPAPASAAAGVQTTLNAAAVAPLPSEPFSAKFVAVRRHAY
jgi:hypothetical protein